jgi:hypothetical protein
MDTVKYFCTPLRWGEMLYLAVKWNLFNGGDRGGIILSTVTVQI